MVEQSAAHVKGRGGKRIGAGRKTSSQVPGLVSAQEILPQHRTFASLVVRGMKLKDICNMMNISMQTTRNWRDQAWFPIVAEEERNKLLGNPLDVFSPMLGDAIQVYGEALKHGDTKIAQNVFDRIYGTPVQRSKTEGQHSVVIVFSKLGDDGPVIEGESRVIE